MSHKSLPEALLAFQKNPPHIELDSRNPHFKSKFAGLPGITKAVKGNLATHGLVYAQPLDHIEGAPAIRTILIHAATGERIEGLTPLLLGGKTDPQSHGSAVTYARRYGLLSILGLVGDEDDDGNAASAAPVRQAAPRGAGTPTSPPPDDDVEFAPELPEVEPQSFKAPEGAGITEKQRKFLKMVAEKLIKDEGNPWTVDAFRAHLDATYGVTSTTALTKKQATEAIDHFKGEAVAAGLMDE